jgi:hypothetical protein
MAHYAFLDENNVVTEVIVGKDESNFDWEAKYGMFRGQVCKRTSYNTRGGVYYNPNTNEINNDQSKAFRKNYAGVGYTYDPQLDAFIAPQPFESWLLNNTSCLWEAPVAYPTDGKVYIWNESITNWEELTL